MDWENEKEEYFVNVCDVVWEVKLYKVIVE